MGMVTSLRFDNNCGAVLVNEEYMNVRHRRKLFLDPAQSLLTEEMSNEWHMEALYAGCGNPGINQEIFDSVSRQLSEMYEKYRQLEQNKPTPPSLEDISILCARAMQKIIRREEDLKLNLFYGFKADDLNRGSYKSDGKEWQIKQEKVKKKAGTIVQGTFSNKNTGLFNKTRALLFGHDSKFGICAYHLDITNGNVAFNQEAFEAIGDGKYGVQTSFSRYLNNLSSEMRKDCKDRINGVYELIRAGLMAREAYNFTGGNFTLILINGDEKKHNKRYLEFGDESGRLLTHIVEAREAEFISHEQMKKLLEAVLFSSKPRTEIEDCLFDYATDPRALDFILRGYKRHEIHSISSKWKQKTPDMFMSTGRNSQTAAIKGGNNDLN